MSLTLPIRRAVALAGVVTALTTSTVAAFQPTVTLDSIADQHGVATDLVSRSGTLAVTADWSSPGSRYGVLYWSTDGGSPLGWTSATITSGGAVDQSQAEICGGSVVGVARKGDTTSSTSWRIVRFTYDLAAPIAGTADISTVGNNRKPDVACVANQKTAIAWFQKGPSGWSIRLHVRLASGEDLAPQTLTVGTGTMSKGLAIAASAQRVLVAWVDGNALKVRRYSVGPAPDLTLTSLGTTTVVTHRSVRDPRIATDGKRVVIAYQHQADLRVRWSTNRGQSFGSAKTLRNNPYPSEIGTSPTTLTLVGKAAALGALELAGVETLSGKGLGYLTRNGGATWTVKPKHMGGRTVATLVRVSGTDRYAEAWDESISDPVTEDLRFRRE